MATITKVLIANRGEIAVRVIRGCRELGIATVAVYSDADHFAMHARLADEAIAIGPAPAHESYLHIPTLIAAAHTTHADAIHPGYGFLSENAAFAEACRDAGLIFIGPPPEAIRLMGSKMAAKSAVMAVDVPTVPGYQGEEQSVKVMQREAQRIGYPVMIKAAAGGGGKGMRVVQRPDDFRDALGAAQREANAAFGDATVFLERALVQPRHVEFQIMADAHGHCIHLGERECSIQRRHQKVIEESPSVALTPELRETMGAAAVRAALAAGYVNAGTVEFLLDREGRYYFLEMNTRLQVEHPVTEGVTGRDLVRMQLAVAAGEPLTLRQDDITSRGHAIEVRVYAEDPITYLPATGTLLAFAPPTGPGIRLDSGVATGDAVSMYYDPMLAKLIVTADDRALAIARLRAALNDFAVLGITTNLALLRRIAADDRFERGETFTDFLQSGGYDESPSIIPLDPILLVAAAVTERDSIRQGLPTKQSPWAAGALRSGRFSTRYQIDDVAHTVSLSDDPSGGFHAVVDDLPVTLGGDGMTFTAFASAGSSVLVLRVGTRQRRIWVVRRPDDGALLVTDATTTLTCAKPRPLDVDSAAHVVGGTSGQRTLTSPMAGTVIQVRVAIGDRVAARQTLLILSAMKMEHAINAPFAAIVRHIGPKTGDVVTGGAILIELEAIVE